MSTIQHNHNISQHAVQTPFARFLPLVKHPMALRNGRGFIACCPAHDDKHPSLGLWEDPVDLHVGLCCYAGCSRQAICAAVGLTEADLYVSTGTKRSQPKVGIDMYELAADKLIWPTMFDTLGITDGHRFRGKKAVHIPYCNPDGTSYPRYRIRIALQAKNGSFWSKGSEAIIPYGLERLKDARNARELLIVEGESDCWAAWWHHIPAIGIPGVMHYAGIKPDYLTDIDRVYIVQEPPSPEDKAKHADPGKAFVDSVYAHLVKIGYQGQVYAIDCTEFADAKDINALHKLDHKAFPARLQTLKDKACSMHPDHALPETKTFADLLAKELPPMRWIVPQILTEGLNLLAGKQKLGKSWWLLALGLAVSTGSVFLGNIKVEQGEVLYLALEDSERRLQDRLRALLPPDSPAPVGFQYATRWPRLDAEGLLMLDTYLSSHPAIRLIIIDTWGRAKPLVKYSSGYDADVQAAAGIQTLATEKRVSILATCHLRKAVAENALDELNATTGLSATADNILILKREHGQSSASLLGIGREIDVDLALSFSEGHWTALGDGAAYRVSGEQKEVLDVLRLASSQGMGPKEIAHILSSPERKVSEGTIRARLFKMKEHGLVKEVSYGKYVVTNNNNNNVSSSSNTSNSDDVANNAHSTNTTNITNTANTTNSANGANTANTPFVYKPSVSDPPQVLASVSGMELLFTQPDRPMYNGSVSSVSSVSAMQENMPIPGKKYTYMGQEVTCVNASRLSADFRRSWGASLHLRADQFWMLREM